MTPFGVGRSPCHHEREVRAVVTRFPSKDRTIDFSQETIQHGLLIPINLDVLIERIYVAPDAPAWFDHLVKSIVKRYKGNYVVTKSDLCQSPLY